MKVFIHIALVIIVALIVAMMIIWPDTHNALHWLAAMGVMAVAVLAVRRTVRAEARQLARKEG